MPSSNQLLEKMEAPMTSLFLSNVPHNCEDAELRDWVESQGFAVDSVRIVRDLVTGVSPAFGYIALKDSQEEIDAIRLLDGQELKGRTLQVKQDWRKAQTA
jgi:RNA recognition motif-containing protein